MPNKLSVLVSQQAAGTLLQEHGSCVFSYNNTATAEQFVSLTMPVRARDYVHTQLHPIFEMHLPEGYLLALIKRHFSKLIAANDFGLLQLMSVGIRGRLQYQETINNKPPLTLDELLYPENQKLFDELVQRFALQSAVSGVQPKVLAQVLNKATLKLENYIVKAWGPEYPQLALNEYWCMRVLQEAGVPVPEFYLSNDAALFIMKRFDITDTGDFLGFEDIGVLQARGREQKYEGSYEQMIKTISSFVSPQHKNDAMHSFFKMMVINQTLQNGDAHLKNFGVLYTNINNIWLAPAYDVISTTAYIWNDSAALTLMGSRKWWSRKHLIKFGVNSCGLSTKQANELYDECEAAQESVAKQIEKHIVEVTNSDQRKILEHLLSLLKQ
ncbi:type II toxin-antitoxin system HipA family toxin [Aliidiomarina quisquiliarum]|uniref:type II toxin-antitoxin system HipA family toxin n=1 Tax=Aliidiomarina quisquiliarum TaxID=2938947 RepID=UPI00208F6622|nr:type II toxin-antitoxin system HipA family toxin [Aliidiomarina quisquiliarum]MCO4321705.1 type II toxin-antitoxin system HipA family toxin [Aliidiomarina quisquiliarum]